MYTSKITDSLLSHRARAHGDIIASRAASRQFVRYSRLNNRALRNFTPDVSLSLSIVRDLAFLSLVLRRFFASPLSALYSDIHVCLLSLADHEQKRR